MECSGCGHMKDRVVETRMVVDGVRRRRKCLGCGRLGTTHEWIDEQTLGVIINGRVGKRTKVCPGVCVF